MPQVLDLNQVVADVHTMLKRMIGEDIDLVTILEQNLRRVNADSGQIEQVLLNLAVNARDAMPQGGKLTIETANVELDESYVRNHVTMKSGSYVMLAVSDSGTGMDAETQKRMFEPFFTTKGQGKGTGLGLSTVYGIVKQSGGYIWAYSEPGHGTTFKVYLPQVNEQPVEIVGPKKANAEELCGTETILIVEDDAAVCTLVHSTLELYGYQVLEATNGAEALLVSEQCPGKIHLLLTDLVMPGISGRVLAERMAISHAGMKVIYMSGYTDDTVVRHGVLAATTAYLQKPFTPGALSRKVREVLDDKGDPALAS
jgi:CheY-like chemotaxis protein